MFDPFDLLGLKRSFSLDLETLQTHYFEAQKKFHPDRFLQVDGNKKKDLLKASGQVNQAYALLKEPVQRARILLELLGIEPLSEDPSFLMLLMDWKERQDIGEDLTVLLAQEEKDLLEDLKKAFEDKNYEKASSLVTRLTYIQKFRQDGKMAKKEKD